MNAKQLSAVQHLTNRLNTMPCVDGRFCFTVHPAFDNGEIMVSASTAESDLRWFEKSTFVLAIVGVRGGIHLRNASRFIRHML